MDMRVDDRESVPMNYDCLVAEVEKAFSPEEEHRAMDNLVHLALTNWNMFSTVASVLLTSISTAHALFPVLQVGLSMNLTTATEICNLQIGTPVHLQFLQECGDLSTLVITEGAALGSEGLMKCNCNPPIARFQFHRVLNLQFSRRMQINVFYFLEPQRFPAVETLAISKANLTCNGLDRLEAKIGRGKSPLQDFHAEDVVITTEILERMIKRAPKLQSLAIIFQLLEPKEQAASPGEIKKARREATLDGRKIEQALATNCPDMGSLSVFDSEQGGAMAHYLVQ